MSGNPFHRTEAICLRVIDYSETSQILRFYARESGKISCIAKGAKRKKSTFRGAFHFLAVYNLVRMEKMSGSLDLVTQAELIEDFHHLAEDYGRYSTACYIAEFLDTFTLDGQVVGNLYEITLEALHRLQQNIPLPDLLFSFEAKALRALGFFPRLRECGGCRNSITTSEAYFAPRDGGVICLRCRPRDQKRFLVRRAALEKAGKRDNTLILVLSDNGASHQMSYDKGNVPDGSRPGSADTFLNQGPVVAALNNVPFRNYKVSNFEGGIASPLVAWWPSRLQGKGRITDRLTHITDIMPTCLELAGVTYPKQFEGREVIPLDGESFASVLRAENETIASRVLTWPKAVRDGDWKLVWKNPAKPELFNIGKDRNEMKNLAPEFPERVRKMKQIHSEIFRP